MPSPLTIHVTTFPAPFRWALKGIYRELPWERLKLAVEKPELWPGEPTIAASEDRLQGITFAQLQDNTRVIASGAVEALEETEGRITKVGGLIIEYIDEPLADEEHIARWWKGRCYLAYTTAYHQRPMSDRPAGPRWRVLLPFDRPVSLADARLAARWARHPHQDSGNISPLTERMGRVAAFPALAPGGYACTIGDGAALDPDSIHEDLLRWADEDRRTEARRAVAGTTLPEALRSFQQRLEQPGRRAFMPWPGTDASLPATDPERRNGAPVLTALGQLAGSLWPGRLAVLAGGSGSGRTSLALQLAVEVASRGYPVLYASSNLPIDEIVARVLIHRALAGGPSVPRSHAAILQGAGAPADLAHAAEDLLTTLPSLYLWTPTTPERTDEALRARAAGVAADSGGRPPLVIVDPIEGFEDGKELTLAYRQLSAACRDLVRPNSLSPDWPGAAVLAVVGVPGGVQEHLSTAVDLRAKADTPEGRADLREAMALEIGGLGTDAALLLALARDAVEASGMGAATVAVTKNRHGHTGLVSLQFYGAPGYFAEA